MDIEEHQESEDEQFEDVTEPPSKKSKKEGKKKMKQPTVEELTELNETVALFKNNLFRLQISELLKAVKIHDKKKNLLNSWLKTFEDFLKNLPVSKNPNPKDTIYKKVISQCRNYLQCDKDIPLTFMGQNDMRTFGIYKIESLPGPNIAINIHLSMPKAYFQEKDFLNNRYFAKKFFFLMYIAEHLKLSEICSNIKCSYYQDNVLTPYLLVIPNISDKISVNIFAVPEQKYFKEQRFLPDVNNVRAPVFANYLPIQDLENYKHVPTCFYNASLCFDVTLMENNLFIETILSNLPNVQEGLKLIIIWMSQRQFNVGLGAFSNDIIIYIIIYLVQKRHINNHMSSYQVFRNFLNFMNITDLTENPISVCEDISDVILEKFKSSFDLVIMDKTGFYNVASFVDINVYLKMRHECQLAFNTLDKSTSSSFQELLLFKVSPFLQYDGVIDIRCPNNFRSLLENIETEEKVKYLGAHKLLIVKRLQSFLKKGLNKRIASIAPLTTSQSTWEYGVCPKIGYQRSIFGIRLDPVTAFQILEYGPNLNDPGEKDFRQFWGKLTSNRRFQDGTAKVVVCFEAKTIKNKREIIKTIVNFIIKDRLNFEHKFYYDEFEEVLLSDRIDTWYSHGTNEETSIAIIRSSDELGKKIRTLDVQLGITGIVGISDVFCYTNVFPQIPTQYRSGKTLTKTRNQNIILKDGKLKASPKYVAPVECAVQLEHSSKWPGDLKALRAMKTLFYLEISKLLDKKHNIISSVKESHIDILYEGIVFRYIFYLSKEMALLKREVKENGMLCSKDTEESLEIEKKFSAIPKIIGALKGIISLYPCYGVSTCLAKRWIRAQLIDDYLLPDIVIDLLNAYQFLNHSLYSPAVSPQVAFLRFLKYVIEAQWDLEPVVLNFNEELTKEVIGKIDNKLHSNRDNYPPLYILTPYDNGESVFTRKAPSKQILTRLKSLACESLKIIETSILSESFIDVKSLFVPNTNGYDCLIHLKMLTNPRRHEQIFRKEVGKIAFSKPSEEDKLLPVIDFDPVALYLKELRKTYGAFCLFFHDTYGGEYIGVLWKPNVTVPKDVKLSNMLGRTMENDVLVLNKKEIMTGFEVLGNGIFKSIDVKT